MCASVCASVCCTPSLARSRSPARHTPLAAPCGALPSQAARSVCCRRLCLCRPQSASNGRGQRTARPAAPPPLFQGPHCWVAMAGEALKRALLGFSLNRGHCALYSPCCARMLQSPHGGAPPLAVYQQHVGASCPPTLPIPPSHRSPPCHLPKQPNSEALPGASCRLFLPLSAPSLLLASSNRPPWPSRSWARSWPPRCPQELGTNVDA